MLDEPSANVHESLFSCVRAIRKPEVPITTCGGLES